MDPNSDFSCRRTRCWILPKNVIWPFLINFTIWQRSLDFWLEFRVFPKLGWKYFYSSNPKRHSCTKNCFNAWTVKSVIGWLCRWARTTTKITKRTFYDNVGIAGGAGNPQAENLQGVPVQRNHCRCQSWSRSEVGSWSRTPWNRHFRLMLYLTTVLHYRADCEDCMNWCVACSKWYERARQMNISVGPTRGRYCITHRRCCFDRAVDAMTCLTRHINLTNTTHNLLSKGYSTRTDA